MPPFGPDLGGVKLTHPLYSLTHFTLTYSYYSHSLTLTYSYYSHSLTLTTTHLLSLLTLYIEGSNHSLYLLVVALVIPLVIAVMRSARLRCLVLSSSVSQKLLASRKRWLCSSLS